jgi:deoxycytidine triphosphate deaminase/intein/homing endonuclease
MVARMILSDHTIREELARGRIGIEPYDESSVQPSSVDLRLDRYFRVFLNHTMPVIDVKQDLSELTREVEIEDGAAFILHPGEFVLASTLERLTLPDDLVARIEGKSSLGRLGLLIHSSLPASEEVLVLERGGLVRRTIGELVKNPRDASVVGFDPDTFEVSYHAITGLYEGPPDRIFEVRLASGRSVRVTGGHNLFTLDRQGHIHKVRTGELQPGVMVAVPRRVPEPPEPVHHIRVLDLAPEAELRRLCLEGPTVEHRIASDWPAVEAAVRAAGFGTTAAYYRSRGRLPWSAAALLPGLVSSLGSEDRVGARGERHSLPAVVDVDAEVAWMLGMYVAEGYRREGQVTISNTSQARLDRLERIFGTFGISLSRSSGAVTCCSRLVSQFFGWLEMGGKAPTKRIPAMALGWSDEVLDGLLTGIVDGDGSFAGGRTSVWTTSSGLVSDLLLVFARLGKRAGSCPRLRPNVLPSWQVYAPDAEHKLLTTAPLPDVLLRRVRTAAGLAQHAAALRAGYRHASDLNNIEQRRGRDAIRTVTIRRLRDTYAAAGAPADDVKLLSRLSDGDLAWDRVVEVVDTGSDEHVYDLEVRPAGRKIENFLVGSGGVFVSNTAGFIDAGFDGHITLELSNVANLPITLYPGMKIGQVSFLQMTTPADVPYGSAALGSKYQGQRGPTPSRYWENFTAGDG